MAEWIAHHGKGYPFTGEPPTVLVRIRALDRATVEEKGNWLPSTAWKVWRHNGGPGDIMEIMIK